MDLLTTEVPPTQPIKQPPFTPVPPRTKAIIYVMIFIGILLIFLVTPVPYYQSEEVYCKPGQMNCPGIGWHWNKTLYQSFQGFLLSSPRSQSIRVDTPQSTLLPTTEVTPEPIGSATTANQVPDGNLANWKTYTNTKYGFSFKYPSELSPEQTFEPDKSPSIVMSGNLNKSKPNSHFSMVVGYTWGVSMDATGWDAFKSCATDDECYKAKLEEYNKFSANNQKEVSAIIMNKKVRGLETVDNNQQGRTFPLSKNEKFFSISYGFVNYSQAEIDNTQPLFDQILSTFKFLDTNTPPSPQASNGKILTYSLPEGWKKITDNTDTMEAGYNPNDYLPSVGNSSITLTNIQYPVSSLLLTIRSYTGGSRHQFIYDQLGYTASMAKDERLPDYYEVEYTYKNRSCLVLYGLGYSARGTTWGMCAISPTQAIFIEGGDQSLTEKTISSIALR